MTKEKLTQLVDYALCYLLSNCDDENVSELFETLTNSEQPQVWANLIEQAQKIIYGQ